LVQPYFSRGQNIENPVLGLSLLPNPTEMLATQATEIFSGFYIGELQSTKKFGKNRKHQQGQSAIAKEMNNRVIQSNSKQMHDKVVRNFEPIA